MNKEEIRHFKALLRQGILRHRSLLLDAKFQSELLNIIKGYEHLEQQCKKQKEVIDKVFKYVEDYTSGERIITYEQYKSKLLGILKEVSE